MPKSDVPLRAKSPVTTVGPRALLLDTHVWIWLMLGELTLKKSAALKAVEQAALDARLLVSAISIWEIGMLEAKGRIVLPLDIMHWVENALAAPGVRLQPLTPAIALHSSRLPADFHGDPADRILVATARIVDAVLVTRDARILAYGAAGLVKTLAV